MAEIFAAKGKMTEDQIRTLEALREAHAESVSRELEAENWDYRSDREEPEGKL